MLSVGVLMAFLPPSAKMPGMPPSGAWIRLAKELSGRLFLLPAVLMASLFLCGDLDTPGTGVRLCGALLLAGALFSVSRLHAGWRLYLAVACVFAAGL